MVLAIHTLRVLDGHGHTHACAIPWNRFDHQAAADHSGSLLHSHQSQATTLPVGDRVQGEAPTIVLYLGDDLAVFVRKGHLRPPSLRMSSRIG